MFQRSVMYELLNEPVPDLLELLRIHQKVDESNK